MPGGGFFFHILKILIFGPWGLGLEPKIDQKLLGHSRKGINDPVSLSLGKVLRCLFDFLKW